MAFLVVFVLMIALASVVIWLNILIHNRVIAYEREQKEEVERSIIFLLNGIEENPDYNDDEICFMYNVEYCDGTRTLCYKPDCGYYWKEKP